jgi:hypothetical protein
MVETISNIYNKYLIGKESEFGTMPEITQLDFGYVQTISIEESEGVEEISAINTLHTLADLDDDLYNVTGTITTKLSHPSIANILEALCGKITEDDPEAGKYTIETDAVTSDDLSYSMKVNTETGKTLEITGICFTGGEISIERDGSTEVSLDYVCKKVTPATETLDPETPVGKVYRGLDACVTYDGEDTRLEDFSLSLDWNYDESDSRGIEDVDAGERRLIQRIIRNQLNLTGSFTSHMDSNIDTGYEDDRDNVPIVLTLSRGTDNEHVFTIANARVTTRSRDLETGDGKKLISCDFTGIDLSVEGDEYSSS